VVASQRFSTFIVLQITMIISSGRRTLFVTGEIRERLRMATLTRVGGSQ
jgi:hypothetical protein